MQAVGETNPAFLLQACCTEATSCTTGDIGGYIPVLFVAVFPGDWRHVLYLPFLSRSNSELLGCDFGACGVSVACIVVAHQGQVRSGSFALDFKAT